LVGQDFTIRLSIGYAKESIASFDLLIIQEGLIALIDFTFNNFACTGRASTSAAGVRKIDALSFSNVKNVLVRRNFDSFIKTFSFVN